MYAQISMWQSQLTKCRAQRGTKNEKHEDFLTNLRRLTLVHEMSGNEEVFRIQEGWVLCPAVIPDTNTNLDVIDNASPRSAAPQ